MSEQDLATYAIVIDDVCVNVIVWDGITSYDPGDGAELVKLDLGVGGIGWTYNPKATKHKWTPPAAPEEPTDGAD